jgi:predicted restriction endonuclease
MPTTIESIFIEHSAQDQIIYKSIQHLCHMDALQDDMRRICGKKFEEYNFLMKIVLAYNHIPNYMACL